MKINTKIRYGLRMLVMLGAKQEVINTGDLGEQMKVSPKYLRKLAGPLERSGLIQSVQGIYGGYRLNKDPGDISISDIFDAFEEKISISGCLGGKSCPLNEECLTRPIWLHLENLIQNEFYRITVKDILENKFDIPSS